ncbi:hypothetical protein [Peribacillus alkalitolerans]|uniref:hypothetical protein n=1 Tax=Peribacillus alkalitolerans TaxID=1550385 RepID=UPI0013D34D65|nr:hypothetical protein [Peribacillus alkalitolerans]
MENNENLNKAKQQPNLEELQSLDREKVYEKQLQKKRQPETTNLEQVLNENSEAGQASRRFDRQL